MVRSLSFFFATALLTACGGTAAGTPSFGGALQNDARSVPVAPRAATTPSSEADVERARAHAAAPALCKAYPSVADNLLSDGDFSQATEPAGASTTFDGGVAFAPGWTVLGSSIELYSSPHFKAPEGTCSIDLDGSPGPGGIAHSNFDTTPGATYVVSFFVSGNGECNNGYGNNTVIKTYTVSVLGKTEKFSYDTSKQNATAGDFEYESMTFKATRSQSTLQIMSTDPKGSDCGAVVAAIALSHG
jgi:hypothetical protein